jgi:hypothetical protein
MVVWPAKATPLRPEAYADTAAKIMRVVARASIELAAVRARPTLINIVIHSWWEGSPGSTQVRSKVLADREAPPTGISLNRGVSSENV